MRRRSLPLTLLLAIAAPAQQSLVSPDILFLSRALRHIGNEVTAVLNYTCTETVYRETLQPPAKAFQQLDLVRVEVAKIGKKEVVGWPGAGKFEDKSVADLIGEGGLLADGIFNLFEEDLFVHRAGQLTYRGPEILQGRKAVRIDYVVGALLAGYTVTTRDGQATVGYSGSFWVDPGNLDLIRLEVNADDVPPFLKLARVSIAIEFQPESAVPSSSVVEMDQTTGAISRDQIQFAGCRKFAGDATITFDPAEEAVRQEVKQPITTTVLPGNLSMLLRLQTPIDVTKSGIGDEIDAIVENDVKSDRRLLLPKGSIVRGRIRRLERRAGNPDYVLAGLEFSTADVGQTHYEFIARLASTSGANRDMMRHENAPSRQFTTTSGGLASVQTSVVETLDIPMIGVGYLYLNSAPFVLPSGFRMLWKTQELRHAQ